MRGNRGKGLTGDGTIKGGRESGPHLDWDGGKSTAQRCTCKCTCRFREQQDGGEVRVGLSTG